MDSHQRKLVELQEAILKLTLGEKADPELIKQAQYSLAGGRINTGPGNDTVIINEGANNGTQCVQGVQGTQGIQGIQGSGGESGEAGSQGLQGFPGPIGPIGPPGECTCQCQAILVSEDYSADRDDYYIGVNSAGPTVIQLPCNSRDCDEIVVKAEMGPPLGNRKITIIPCQDSTACKIDGEDSYVIEVPYQAVNLIYRGGNWWII
ncbi:hypothetical protein EB118_13410 [bacterium]|nr:hypothetical protein [bacterium]